jgi:hypothetical protein
MEKRKTGAMPRDVTRRRAFVGVRPAKTSWKPGLQFPEAWPFVPASGGA